MRTPEMRVAMLLHKSIEHDSRVRREARALAEAGHQVTVLHLPRVRGELDGNLDGFQVTSVTPPAWLRRALPAAVGRVVSLAAYVLALLRRRPDIVHAHDAAMLAPGIVGARALGARLVYDSHELATGVPYRSGGWDRVVRLLEGLLAPRCAAVITVSEGIAARLRGLYRLGQEPLVVRNLPDPADDDPGFQAPDLRGELGLEPTTPLVLHLGAAAADRGCETLIRAIREVPGAHLVFLGAGGSEYAGSLATLVADLGLEPRVHILAPVPVTRIRSHARQASVGVTLLEDTCENHRLALPNKVFEYIAAEVPVLAGDLPELRRLVTSLGVGRLADPTDPQQLGAQIAAVLDDPQRYREALEAAGPSVSWSTDSAILVGLYAQLALRLKR